MSIRRADANVLYQLALSSNLSYLCAPQEGCLSLVSLYQGNRATGSFLTSFDTDGASSMVMHQQRLHRSALCNHLERDVSFIQSPSFRITIIVPPMCISKEAFPESLGVNLVLPRKLHIETCPGCEMRGLKNWSLRWRINPGDDDEKTVSDSVLPVQRNVLGQQFVFQ